MSVRFSMNGPWLSPLPQQYVSMSSLDTRVFCVPLVSIRLLLLGWSLDLCVIYGLSISSVYVQLWFLYFLAGIHRKGPDLKLFEARRSLQFFDMSFSVMRQHSDPYNRVARTQLLYNFNFVCVLYCCDFHTGLSILKAFLALPILLMMSLPAPPSCLTVLPRYVNWSVYGKGSSSTFTGAGF